MLMSFPILYWLETVASIFKGYSVSKLKTQNCIVRYLVCYVQKLLFPPTLSSKDAKDGRHVKRIDTYERLMRDIKRQKQRQKRWESDRAHCTKSSLAPRKIFHLSLQLCSSDFFFLYAIMSVCSREVKGKRGLERTWIIDSHFMQRLAPFYHWQHGHLSEDESSALHFTEYLTYLLVRHYFQQCWPVALYQPFQLRLNVIWGNATLGLDPHGLAQFHEIWILFVRVSIIETKTDI